MTEKNDLKRNAAEIVAAVLRTFDTGRASFTEGEWQSDEYFVRREKLADFDLALRQLHAINSDVSREIHIDTFKQKVLGLVVPARRENKQPQNDEVKDFLRGLVSTPLLAIRVFACVSGGQLEREIPLKLGPFTLYSVTKHWTYIEADSYILADSMNVHLERFETLIAIEIIGRDPRLAREQATLAFRQFENAVSLMMNNRHSGSGVRVSTGSTRTQHVYTFAPDGDKTSALRQLDAGIWPVFDNGYFNAEGSANQYLWSLMNIPEAKRTDMQKRVLVAVDWAGQALLENSNENALLKAAIALEALLSTKDEPVTKTISEFVAQILGTDIEGRLAVEKQMKRLYSVRSKVVHGNHSRVTRDDAQQFIDCAVTSIHYFLTIAEMKKLEKYEQLTERFGRLRYAAPSLW